MKVLYDEQIFSSQKIGGISRYFYELIKRNEEAIFPIIYSDNFYLKKTFNLKFGKKIKHFLKKINQFKVKKFLIKGNYDIFHPTYYNNYFLKYLKTPFIITVHDMIHEIYADSYFRNDTDISKLKRELCEKADGIIAISEHTKRDLIKIFNINSNKIKVIYHGSNLKKETKKIDLPKRYILFTGSRSLYKNFDLFIEAVSNLLQKDKKLYLVCTGKEFDKNEKNKLKKLNIDDKVYQILANDNEMYTIYHNAECFVFPSLYEGFGIPILEAWESECPIALSNTSCFPEITSDAGEYFNPQDKESIKKAVENIIYNPKRKRELVEKGKERLKNFSWDKTYQETLDFYKEILEKKEKENANKLY